MVKEKEKDIIALASIAGVGLGGYFLWKSLKKKDEETIGFIIAKLQIWQEGEQIGEPVIGLATKISVLGRNNTEETVEGYCEITNLDTNEIVLSETATVDSKAIKTFNYQVIMPETTLRLSIETGKIIDLEKVKDYVLTKDIVPSLPVGAEIIELNPTIDKV